jgi:hemoglobin
MERKCLPLALPFILPLSLVACAAKIPSPPRDPQPEGHALYDRLGGKEGVHGVVDAFLQNLLADSRVSAFFRGDKGLPKLEQQLCELSGGPCRYTGKDMKAAHGGMGISGPQFEAFLQDFKRALDDKGVSRADENELLGALSPMRAAIVEKEKK